jgi:hypothetical protein
MVTKALQSTVEEVAELDTPLVSSVVGVVGQIEGIIEEAERDSGVEQEEPKAARWGYRVPSAGVRYYFFET